MNWKISFLVVTILCLTLSAPVHAQPARKMHRIGFLTNGSVEGSKPWLAAFRQGLRDLGYQEGKNIIIEERYAAGQRQRLPGLAAELVNLKVDVIITHGASVPVIADRAAKEAGTTIPIVFPINSYPIGSGAVASLAKPGGNITGLSDFHTDLAPKRLEIIKEIIPSASRIAVLWTPDSPASAAQLKILQAVAPKIGLTIIPVKFAKPEDLAPAFAKIRRERPDALNVLGYPLVGAYRKQIAAFALEHRLPTMSTFERFAASGGLVTYGVNFRDQYRRAATYVDKILKGAKPAEMPVEQPIRYYLTINLKTANALGLKIPPFVLYRATRIIR